MKTFVLLDEDTLNQLTADVKQIKRMVEGSLFKIAQDKELVHKEKKEERYCDSAEAMRILGVRKTTLQTLRDSSPENGIIISRPTGSKKVLYHRQSLYDFLDSKRQE